VEGRKKGRKEGREGGRKEGRKEKGLAFPAKQQGQVTWTQPRTSTCL
jgi:hypothetical protein